MDDATINAVSKMAVLWMAIVLVVGFVFMALGFSKSTASVFSGFMAAAIVNFCIWKITKKWSDNAEG